MHTRATTATFKVRSVQRYAPPAEVEKNAKIRYATLQGLTNAPATTTRPSIAALSSRERTEDARIHNAWFKADIRVLSRSFALQGRQNESQTRNTKRSLRSSGGTKPASHQSTTVQGEKQRAGAHMS